MAGQVRVADQVVLKPATAVDTKAVLTVDTGPRFVSRGGEKFRLQFGDRESEPAKVGEFTVLQAVAS